MGCPIPFAGGAVFTFALAGVSVASLPGKPAGTHQLIGSEELCYIVEGEGIAYMGEHDDPALAAMPVVERSIFGVGKKRVRELPVGPGNVIYTKSGGIHGIRNPGAKPLRVVAFLYHSA